MTERQLTRAIRILTASIGVLGLALIAIAYAPFTIMSFALRDYMDVQLSTAHAVGTMVVLLLVPGAFVWWKPRWRTIGLWFLWAMAIAIYALEPYTVSRGKYVGSAVHSKDVTAWYAAMNLVGFAIGVAFIVLLGIAGYERLHTVPDARVVKR